MPQEEGPLGGITDDMLSLLKSPLPMEEKKAEPVAVPQMEEKHGITPEMWSIFQTPPPAATPAAPVPAAAKSVPEETPEEWAARIERQFRRERQAFEPPVERSLPGEVAASIGRGVLGIAKLPFEVAKIVGADVLGSQTAKRTLEPILWKFEEAAQSPLLRPSTSAGKPIELDRILEDPSGVAQQIAENVTNPSFWAAQVPEAALSMVPFFAGNLGARIAGQAFKYGKAIKAIQASEYLSEAEKAAKLADIGEKLARLGTIGGYGAGMAMEATQAEEQLRQYEEESGKRVNWGPRVLAILGTGLVSGSLEALSMERIFFGKHGAPSLEGMVEKLFEGKGGSILARKVLDSIATEGTTEGAQQIVQNAFAKIGYNPDQKLTEGVVESILIGAAVGGLAGNAEIFHEAVRQYAPYLKELKTRAEAERQARLAALPEFMPIYRTTPTAATAEREFIPVPTEAEEAAARRAEEERVAALPETSPIYRTGPAPGVPMEPLPAGAPPVVPLRGLEADILKEPGPEPTEVSPTKPMDFTGRRPGWPAETLDLERRLDSLLRLVDEEDDPRAAREIHNLLLAHRAEVEAALTPPQTAQPGMLPVIRRVDELYRRVEETGDVEAARELHHLLVGNRERLTGMTREQLRRLAEQPLAPSAEEVMQVDQTPTIAPTEPSEVPPPAAPPQAPTPPAGEVPSAPPTPPLAVPAAPEAPAPAATTETKAQIEGAGQGKAEFSPGVLEGMQAWLRNQIYIDDAGNYRSKETREIVPYNRELKQTFPQTEGLTEAAKRQFPEIVAELKANEEARRQLLQNRVEMPPPEAPPVPPVPEAKAPTKEELSLEDQIEELKREIDKKKEELAKYVQTPEVQGQVYGISPALPHITIGSQVPSKSELLDAAVRKMEVEYGRGKPSDVQQGEAVGGKEPATSVGTEAIEAAQEFRKKFGITKGSQEGVKDVLKFRLSVPPKTPPGKGLSLKEKAAIVLEQFKGLPEEHVYLVLRALPDAAPNEVAAMVQYPELFDKVLRGEMALSDREFQAKRQDEGFQWALPGTGVGGLFEAPPERPAGTEPKKSTKYQLTKEENLARGREVMEKVISEKTDVPVGKVLTQGMVEAAFPGAEVRRGRLFEGYRVLLPHMEIGILLNGDIQIPDIESLRKAGYREEDLKDLHEWVAAGHWRTIPGGGVITIAKGLTPLEAGETLRHETFHAACDLVLSDKERRAILQKYGDWETAARAYEEWVPERRPNTLFQKILDFFRRIYEAFRPTYESVFEKIHRGEVWGRKPREVDVFGLPLRFKVIKEADETIERYRERYLAPSEPAEPRGIVEKARGIKASLTEKAMRFYEQVVDKWAAWERLERRALQAGAKVPAGELITTSLSFMRGVEGRVRQALTGQYVYQDKLGFEEKRRADVFTGDELVRKGPSFQVRLEPLRELAHRRGMKTAEVMDNFEVLLVAQRDLELAGEFGNRLPDEIKGVHPEESREVAAALLRKYGDDFKVLQEVSGSLREWSDEAILQPLLQVGIINEEAYQTIKAKNQLYVPFKRLLDETNDYLAAHLGAAGVKGKVLHEIKGSEKQILSPLQTWIELAYKAQWAYARNKVYRAAYMIGQAYEEAGIKELPPKWIPVKSQLKQEIDQQAGLMPFEAKFWARSPLPPEPGCVPYYRDGVRRWLKLPPDLYNAAQNFTPPEMGMLMQIARVPADLLRSGAILVPEFSLGRNPVRDMIQAWVFSRFGFNPFKWFRDAALLVSKNPETLELRRQWEAGGGALATLAESFVAPEKISADYLKGKESKVKYFANPLHALRYASSLLENMTRFSIYKQAREAGLTHAEAIHETRRTTLDFSRAGGHPTVRYLNVIIPFWNAAIQGVDKLATELTGPNRAAVARRLAMLATVSVLLMLHARRDDRYKELDDWERNYFWHLPLGPDLPIIRLPKPFEVGILFGSVPERLVEAALTRSGKGVQSALAAAWEAAMPEFIPTIARPLVEAKANYDFFRGRPIEDVGQQRLPAGLRAKPWTTETAKSIGRLTDISPIQLEHFIRQWTGGLGANYFLPGIDLLLKKTGAIEDIAPPEREKIQQLWGVRAFFSQTPTGWRAKSVNDFLERHQEAQLADQGWKELWKQGKMAEVDKYLREHPEAMFAQVSRQALAEMTKLRQQRDQIYASKTLTPQEKKEKLDKLDSQVLAIARRANLFMDLDAAEKVGMPRRTTVPGKGGKALEPQQYYEVVAGATERAYRRLLPSLPRWEDLEPEERQQRIARAIREERNRPVDLSKLRFGSIWDRPTKAEREAGYEQFGGLKLPTPFLTGGRLRPLEAILSQ